MTTPPPPGTAYLPAWYIPRPALENRALATLANEQPVLLWGPRDQGCTWLCRHLAERWQAADGEAGRRLAVVDFRSLGSGALASFDDCLRAIAIAIEEWLDEDPDFQPERDSIAERWTTMRGDPKVRLKNYVGRTVLPALPGPFLLVFDHADLVHSRPFYEDFAGMLRSWAEKTKYATLPNKHPTPWKNLRLLVAVSVHPARLRTKYYESPFVNLSDPIRVGDFDRKQITVLAEHHGLA